MRASDIAYDRLRAEIIDWALQPGAPLNENETAERIGVSRTPVREALARLAAEGLVTSVGRTARVAPLSREHIVELYELREALETSSARFAARRRDPRRFQALLDRFRAGPADGRADPQWLFTLVGAMDEAIDEAAGSRYIRAELDGLRGQMARVRNYSQSTPARIERATEEHILIVEAVLAGDETLAVHATAVHLRNSLTNVLQSLPGLDDAEAGENAS